MANKSDDFSYFHSNKIFTQKAEFFLDPDADSKRINIVFSTERSITPFWPGTHYFLGHEDKEVDLDWLRSGRAPLLLDHDTRKIVGVIESAKVENGEGFATARFSNSPDGKEVLEEVKNYIRHGVSVGFIVNSSEIVEQKKDGPDLLRVTSWRPLEISLVSVPADENARVLTQDRKIFDHHHFYQRRIQKMNDHKDESSEQSVLEKNAGGEKFQDELQKSRAAETGRISEINALSENYGHFSDKIIEARSDFIKEGKSSEDFKGFVLQEIKEAEVQREKTAQDQGQFVGLTPAEAETFSFIRFFRSLAKDNKDLAPFEHEVVKAASHDYFGENARYVIPVDVLVAPGFLKRELTTTGAGTGQQLVGTFHDAANFIELLRDRLIVAQAGARFMTNLRGNLSIPKQTSGATGYWVEEGRDVTLSDIGTGSVVLSPKTAGAASDITRLMLLQSSPDVEALVREDILKTVARVIDTAAFQGTNANGQPKGILNHNIGAIDYGDDPVDWSHLVGLEGELDQDDALMGGLSYFVHPKMVVKLKTKLKSAGVDGYLWENPDGGLTNGLGFVNGYRAFSTKRVPEADILFGNMNDLLVGQWGGIGINYDTSTKALSGGLRIVVLQSVDIGVRHEESFAKATT